MVFGNGSTFRRHSMGVPRPLTDAFFFFCEAVAKAAVDPGLGLSRHEFRGQAVEDLYLGNPRFHQALAKGQGIISVADEGQVDGIETGGIAFRDIEALAFGKGLVGPFF